jgi:hypothetical protein
MFETTFTPKPAIRTQLNHQKHPMRSGYAADWFTQSRLSEIHQRFPNLPLKSILLGISEDEWPVLIDLADPGIRPIIILGDSRSGKTHLLKIILQSAINQAPENAMQFAVIDPDHQFDNILKQAEDKDLCLFSTHAQVNEIREKVLKLAEITEKRHTKQQQNNDILFIIDGLDILQTLDMDTQHSLEWLFKFGPYAHVWPIVSLNSEKAANFSRWIRLFPMRLLTHMPKQTGHRFGLFEGVDTGQILPRKQFCVHLPSGWLTFWVPQKP